MILHAKLPPQFNDKGHAPCRETDVEIFFPERGKPTAALKSIRTAQAICRRCPYKDPCLEWALTHHEIGIWGATTEGERRRIRRSRKVK